MDLFFLYVLFLILKKILKKLGEAHQSLRLLSGSMDRTMIIWEYCSDSGLWENRVRVGELGGNSLGFYGGLFGPEGKYILAHGYNGTFHLWKKKNTENESKSDLKEF